MTAGKPLTFHNLHLLSDLLESIAKTLLYDPHLDVIVQYCDQAFSYLEPSDGYLEPLFIHSFRRHGRMSSPLCPLSQRHLSNLIRTPLLYRLLVSSPRLQDQASIKGCG